MNNIESIEEKEIIESYKKWEWKQSPNFETRKNELLRIFSENFTKKARD